MSCGVVLVLAVRRRPALRLVAGVHVEDAPLAAAAERHLAAAVDHDLGPGVVADLRGGLHGDRHRVGTAVERDDARRPRHGVDDRGARAARRRAGRRSRGPASRCRPRGPRPGPAPCRSGCRAAGERVAPVRSSGPGWSVLRSRPTRTWWWPRCPAPAPGRRATRRRPRSRPRSWPERARQRSAALRSSPSGQASGAEGSAPGGGRGPVGSDTNPTGYGCTGAPMATPSRELMRSAARRGSRRRRVDVTGEEPEEVVDPATADHGGRQGDRLPGVGEERGVVLAGTRGPGCGGDLGLEAQPVEPGEVGPLLDLRDIAQRGPGAIEVADRDRSDAPDEGRAPEYAVRVQRSSRSLSLAGRSPRRRPISSSCAANTSSRPGNARSAKRSNASTLACSAASRSPRSIAAVTRARAIGIWSAGWLRGAAARQQRSTASAKPVGSPRARPAEAATNSPTRLTSTGTAGGRSPASPSRRRAAPPHPPVAGPRRVGPGGPWRAGAGRRVGVPPRPPRSRGPRRRRSDPARSAARRRAGPARRRRPRRVTGRRSAPSRVPRPPGGRGRLVATRPRA